MRRRGNKGEWSELYAFLSLLSEGRIYAANEKLERIDQLFFPVRKVFRPLPKGRMLSYHIADHVEMYVDDVKMCELPRSCFANAAQTLLQAIRESQEASFTVASLDDFLDSIDCGQIKASSRRKEDIRLEIHDLYTGYRSMLAFSIKSLLGAAPSLLNAGKTTNFRYLIKSKSTDRRALLTEEECKIVNQQLRGMSARINYLDDQGWHLVFQEMCHQGFEDNVCFIDSQMPEILAECLIHYYQNRITTCRSLVERLSFLNSRDFGNLTAYPYKMKKFLAAVALGMRPSIPWDGIDEASGGYIVVKETGEVLAYHLYNRNAFETYLLDNCRFETASRSRHHFGEVYEEAGQFYMNLNLQIRFIS